MRKHHSNSEFSKSLTQRIEAFTDGVFAIVITLLVLELRIPEVHGLHASEELRQGLTELLPKFVSFAVSFIYISIYWYNHHQLFHPVERLDRKLFWLNTVFLLFLTFIPFPTALIGSYPTDRVAVLCYGLAMMATAISFVVMKMYVKYGGCVCPASVPVKKDLFFLAAGPLLYLVSSLIALVSVSAAIAIYLIVPIIYFFAKEPWDKPS